MENNKQQTAVDFLIEELISMGYLHSKEYGQSPSVDTVIRQAKELEKQHIKDAYYTGFANDIHPDELVNDDAEQYYKETFE